MYKFNINDFIKVKLTEHGKEVYKHRYDEMIKKYPQLKDAFTNHKLKVDKDGYSEFQMHDFMNCFGAHIFNGAPLVIENNEIYFEEGLVAVKPDLGKLRKSFGATEKILKEIEEEEQKQKSQTRKLKFAMASNTLYCHIMSHHDVCNILLNTYCRNDSVIDLLCRNRRLKMEYFVLDKYKSFEVYYLDDKPIIEVTIEKRYGELHGYGYLSQTEEETRTVKIFK